MAAKSVLEVRRPGLLSLIDADAAFEQLGTGFIFTEGPVWHPELQTLTFSDMPGDIMRRWSEARGIGPVRDEHHRIDPVRVGEADQVWLAER